MSVPLAFVGVVLIWSTTPLAIKWSGGDVGFLFGVTSRMILGGFLAMSAVVILRKSYRLDARAKRAYLASGLGVYIAMIGAYWSASYIPSGWLSVIWGTSPVATGIFASIYLGEKFTRFRLFGLLLGLAGLSAIFMQSLEMTTETVFGMVLVTLAVIGQTGTAVWIKKIDAQQHGLVMTAGGLVVAIPLFVLTWFIFDGNLPEEIPARAGGSILYLAVFGTLIGFSLYYFLIHKVEASTLSLVTLITPVTALLLGSMLNDEPITLSIIIGTGFILLGLISFQWGDRWFGRVSIE